MAVSYTSLKCDSCGGTLEHNRERRVWVCLYCGGEMVREENYDGQFSIKWVARQALLSVAERDMKVAEAHLVECSKIDPLYVGTTIARLAHSVVAMSMAHGPEAQRRLTTQISEYYAALKKTPLTPGSDEDNFYESLGSSDAYGVLALVFDTVGDEEREKFVVALIDPASVYSGSAARDMVGYSLSEGNFALVDELVNSPAELDCDFLFGQLLGRYPDSERKPANISRVVSGIKGTEAACAVLDDYLLSTSDCLATRLAITRASFGAGIRPGINACLNSLLPLCSLESEAKEVFEMACGGRLTDEDVARVVTHCAASARANFAVLGLEVLKASGQFVSPSQSSIVVVLSRTDLTVNEKTAVLSQLCSSGQPDRFRQSVISVYLREGAPHPDRAALVGYLVGTVDSLNPVFVEDYLMHFTADGESKSVIVDALLSKNVNANTLKRALSNYLAASPDGPDVTQGVIGVFARRGLVSADIDVVSLVCRANDIARALATIRSMKASGWQPGPRSLDSYLIACAKGTPYAPELSSELYSQDSTISSEAFSTYVLRCVEADATKPQWVRALAARAGGRAGSINCRIGHLDRVVGCTLLQAYLLTAPDPEPVAQAVLQELDEVGGAAQLAVAVTDASGTKAIKFKKYVAANKTALSAAAIKYCDTHGLTGGFF
ncbi:MAG: hypothetical protein U1E26_08160 [Coriobacteriia bacterium]|nr:hypothetical protein [Coriobacteriia bacterium]